MVSIRDKIFNPTDTGMIHGSTHLPYSLTNVVISQDINIAVDENSVNAADECVL